MKGWELGLKKQKSLSNKQCINNVFDSSMILVGTPIGVGLDMMMIEI